MEMVGPSCSLCFFKADPGSTCVWGAFLDLSSEYLLISLLPLTCSGDQYDKPAQAKLAGDPSHPPISTPAPYFSKSSWLI